MTYPAVGPRRTHGTISCYNAGCHCERCTAAARESQRRHRHRRSGAVDRRVKLTDDDVRAIRARADESVTVLGREHLRKIIRRVERAGVT